jgi:hypothetical protein
MRRFNRWTAQARKKEVGLLGFGRAEGRKGKGSMIYMEIDESEKRYKRVRKSVCKERAEVREKTKQSVTEWKAS